VLDEKCVFEFILLVVGALVNINDFVGAVGRSKVKLSSGNLERGWKQGEDTNQN
jgi:hypothetical protein